MTIVDNMNSGKQTLLSIYGCQLTMHATVTTSQLMAIYLPECCYVSQAHVQHVPQLKLLPAVTNAYDEPLSVEDREHGIGASLRLQTVLVHLQTL